MNFFKQMKEGLFTNNPIFVQFLGMCSALAITTSVTNAVGMGLSVTAVLICSNVIISLLRKFIVPQVRIAAFIVVISGFVTVVELVMKAYLPDLNKSLGLFIPLIVVNCIILARAESFASKNGVVYSAVDGLWQGLGYTLAVVVTALVRELLGTGRILAASDGSGGITVLGDWYQPANIFILPPGAFLTLAFLVALFHTMIRKAEKRGSKKRIEAQKAQIISDEEIFPSGTETVPGASGAIADESSSAESETAVSAKEPAKENEEKTSAEPDVKLSAECAEKTEKTSPKKQSSKKKKNGSEKTADDMTDALNAALTDVIDVSKDAAQDAKEEPND